MINWWVDWDGEHNRVPTDVTKIINGKDIMQTAIVLGFLFRQLLWAALMLCLWSGAWFGWVDTEPFSAFIIQSASVAAIVIAVAFVLLSIVMPRPYCRFVCPMGTLFKIGQSDK